MGPASVGSVGLRRLRSSVVRRLRAAAGLRQCGRGTGRRPALKTKNANENFDNCLDFFVGRRESSWPAPSSLLFPRS